MEPNDAQCPQSIRPCWGSRLTSAQSSSRPKRPSGRPIDRIGRVWLCGLPGQESRRRLVRSGLFHVEHYGGFVKVFHVEHFVVVRLASRSFPLLYECSTSNTMPISPTIVYMSGRMCHYRVTIRGSDAQVIPLLYKSVPCSYVAFTHLDGTRLTALLSVTLGH